MTIPTETTGTSFDHQVARIAVGAYDDAQDVRRALMNRIRDLARKRREGIPFDAVEPEKPLEERDFDAEYADDNLGELIEDLHAAGELTDREFDYIEQLLQAAQAAARVENRYEDVFRVVAAEPIWGEYLQYVAGIGHTTAARLLHEFGYCDNEERKKVSNVWSYAGLAPGQEPTPGETLGYSPTAKSLIAYQVPTNMLRASGRATSHYAEFFYEPYKAEQIRRMEHSRCDHCGEPTYEHDREQGQLSCAGGRDVGLGEFTIDVDVPDGATPPKFRGHADLRAKRYLGKKFLKHYWYIARSMAGGDVPKPWVVTHGGHEEHADTFENPEYALEILRR